jgi:hypothetical protein
MSPQLSADPDDGQLCHQPIDELLIVEWRKPLRPWHAEVTDHRFAVAGRASLAWIHRAMRSVPSEPES